MNLEEIKGIGPKTIKLFSKLDIYYLEDLLEYYPYRYNLLARTTLDNTINDSGLITGVVESLPKVAYIRKNFNSMNFRIITENKIIKVTIFNRAFMKKNIIVGKGISLIGKYNNKTNSFTASDIIFNVIDKPKIEVIYHTVSGISSKQINKIILNLFDTVIDIKDYIPYEYVNKYKFIDKMTSIKEIHNPTNIDTLKKAKIRLIYEEFFKFMFKMNYLKYKRSLKDYGLERIVNYNKVE